MVIFWHAVTSFCVPIYQSRTLQNQILNSIQLLTRSSQFSKKMDSIFIVRSYNAMPWDPKKYPKDWPNIVLQMRARAGDRCECMGECGLHKTNPGPRRCIEKHHQPAQWAKGRIVLTCAHLGTVKADGSPGDKHDKSDVRPENLKMLCQKCHLRFDIDEHIANAKRTRENKKWHNQSPLPGL